MSTFRFKIKSFQLGLALILLPLTALSAGFEVDETNSNVNFSVTKVQYVIEPAEFKKVSGSVSESGEAEFTIDIGSVYSNNDVRDNRLVEMFFQTEFFATAVVSAEIDPALHYCPIKKQPSIRKA